MIIWMFSNSFEVFILSRIIGGLSEGNVQMSIAMISDVTSEKNRGRALALVGIAFAVGFTFGPFLGMLNVMKITIKVLLVLILMLLPYMGLDGSMQTNTLDHLSLRLH